MSKRLRWLVGVGAACLAFALTWVLAVAPGTGKLPLDASWQVAAEGTGTVLDMGTLGSGRLRIDSGVRLSRTERVDSVEPGDSDTMTAQVGTSVSRADRDGDAALVRATVQRITLDRETALATDDAANSALQTAADTPSVPVRAEGLSVRFPRGVRAESGIYDLYDATARRAAPLHFEAEDEIDGTRVLAFHQTFDDVDLSEADPSIVVHLPGSSLPASAPRELRESKDPVALSRFYSVDRTVDVEPRSGRIVRVAENTHEYLAARAGEEAATVLDADLTTTAASSADVLDAARADERHRRWLSLVVPWAAVILGIGAITAALGVRILSDRRK